MYQRIRTFSMLTSSLCMILWGLHVPPNWIKAAILLAIAASIAAIVVQKYQYRQWLKSLEKKLGKPEEW